MDNKLNYQQARRIRGQSLSDLFAEQLIGGSDFIPGFKKSIGLKTQARIKGIKEKFDPLNIAKVLTGGSRIGPAILGKLLGRDKKDIEYFAGRARPVGDKVKNMSGMSRGPKGDKIAGIKAGLSKILNFLEKSRTTDIKMIEKQDDFREVKEREDKRRHDELIKALNLLIGRTGPNKIEGGGRSLMDFFGDLKDKISQKAADKATTVAEKKAAEAAVREAEKKAAEEAVKGGVTTVVKDVAITKTEQAVATSAVETATKVAAKDVGENVIKSKARDIIGKSLTRLGTSKVPLVGLAFAAPDVWGRILEGDYTGATISASSAAAGTVPGLGTAGSAALDVVGITRDVYNAVYGLNQLEKDLVNDPGGAKERFAFIGSIVKPMLDSMLPTNSEEEKGLKPIGFNPETGKPIYQPQQTPNTKLDTSRISKGQAARMAPEPEPVSEPPKSAELNSAIETNNDLNIESKVAENVPASITTNVEAPIKTGEGFKPQIGFASVRNQDDTLQRLVYDSTRVV
jgi:hypothetical protein